MKKLIAPLIVVLCIVIAAVAGALLRQSRDAGKRVAAAQAPEIAAHEGDADEKIDDVSSDQHVVKEKHGKKEDPHGTAAPSNTYMHFSRQFVTPVIVDGRPDAMMILDVNLNINDSIAGTIYAEEPRLRDAVLRVLLRQAGDGSLARIFTDPQVLDATRAQILLETRSVVGDNVNSVLIVDVGYQKY